MTIIMNCQHDRRILTTDDGHIMTIRNISKLDLFTLRIKAALEPTLGPATSKRVEERPFLWGELSFRPFEWKP